MRLGTTPACCEPRAQQNRLFERASGRDSFSDDIERGAMRRRREHGFQARGDRDPAIESLQLGRDLALVVIHGEHAVEVAGEGLEENGVGRKRPAAGDASRSRAFDRRRDDLDLLAAEQAALPAVRIERGDGNARA